MTFWICNTCAVEHEHRDEVCAICADDRQWVPADGQKWTTLEEMAAEGRRTNVVDLEPKLLGISSEPATGIGQQAKLVTTAEGSLLWDPIGFLDDYALDRIRSQGPVVAIAASHPHMFGIQVEWSRALGDPPILVAEADRTWVARTDPAVHCWSGTIQPLPGVTLTQPGGHFPGSSVLHWTAGADGRGALLSGDTIFANPDRSSVSFMRSFPNRIPLSGAVVERIVQHVDSFEFDRLYSNFETVIESGAKAVVRRSADRHIGWIRGDFDHLT